MGDGVQVTNIKLIRSCILFLKKKKKKLKEKKQKNTTNNTLNCICSGYLLVL